MSRFDTYIFDIDGTLTATNELIFASFNHITDRYLGKHLSDEEIIKLFGPTEDAIINEWFGNECGVIREEYYEFYRRNHRAMAAVFSGIPELLQALSAEGKYIAAFTGKGKRSADITLSETELKQYFNLIISGDDVVNHKPHPEGILHIIEKSGNLPERTVMIGDSTADIKAARAAGVVVYSVLWDSYDSAKVAGYKPDRTFYTVRELKNWLGGVVRENPKPPLR
jgi:HAD superfamily hydrolase (TIGR01509 family)